MIPLKYISLIRCEHEGVVTLSLSPISRLWTKKRSKLIKTITQRITIQRGNIKKGIIFPFRGVMKYHHVTLYKQMDQIYPQELLNELNRKFSLWYLVCIIKYFHNARSMQGFVVYRLFSFEWKYTPKWMDGLSSKSQQIFFMKSSWISKYFDYFMSIYGAVT